MKQGKARADHRLFRWMVCCALLASFAFLPSTAQHSSRNLPRKSDFLVIEHAERLVVYNRYQQAASEVERSVFARYVPMRILNADDYLSDGFTRCMKVEVEGETFFLLKNSDGTLLSTGPLGFRETYRNATILADTIQILTERSIRFSPVDAKSRALPAETLILCVFRYERGTYCKVFVGPVMFGWIDFAGAKEGRDWKRIGDDLLARGPIPRSTVDRIRAKTGEVNDLFERLFKHFNGLAGVGKTAPQWSVQSSDTSIVCELRHAGRPDDFRESTIYLVKDLENIVLGTGLQVTHVPGRIDIVQRRP